MDLMPEEVWQREIPSQRVIDGINLNDLIDGGTVFSTELPDQKVEEYELADENDLTGREEDAKYFDLSNFQEKMNFINDKDFSELSINMKNICSDGLVKKEIIRPGIGDVVAPNATVIINYSLFFPFQDEPFDCTWRRKQVFRFTLNDGRTIPGLNDAVATMRMKEVSRIFIHWSLAYGERGCLPRILPKQDVLGTIELLKIINVNVPENLEAGTEVQNSFNEVIREAKILQMKGTSHYQHSNYNDAVKCYENVKRMLTRLRLNSDEEEDVARDLRIKIHNNLAVCYWRKQQPAKMCLECKEALYLDPRNSKAMFHFGRANLLLSNFTEAARWLKKGQQINPDSKAFAEELKKLEQVKKASKEREARFAQMSLGVKPTVKPPQELTTSFESSLRDKLKTLSIDDEYVISTALQPAEEECCRKVAKDMNLNFRFCGRDAIFTTK